MRLKYFILLLVLLTCYQHSLASINPYPKEDRAIDWSSELNKHDVPIYTYEIIRKYPHNSKSFTEGLELHQNILYESSGLYGQSKLYKIKMKTGQQIQEYDLQSQYFGEGITLINNNLYQLTYESNIGFIYDAKTLKLKNTFHYPTQGWGLANNGRELILSNGSSSLLFLDLIHFHIIRVVIVHHNNTAIGPLNELEYINGNIYANIYGTNIIAIINPTDGKIKGYINLQGLYDVPKELKWLEVLNGIAYDKSDDTLIVTGKFWPKMYKIKIKTKTAFKAHD